MSDLRKSDPASSIPETTSGSPGSILRRCREFHGITLEEASETTKIGISHLKALEDDQIREFANEAYLKGFLRIYATYLGLNSEDIARMYAKLFGSPTEKADPAGITPPKNRPQRRLISLKKLLFPALLLTLILITATFFNRPPSPARQTSPPATSATPVQSAAIQNIQSSGRDKKPGQPPPVIKIEKKPAGATDIEKPAPPKRPAEVSKGLILKIKVTQNGTLMVTIDGSAAQSYELTVGDVIEWKAEKKATLEVSNAGAIDVELNGRPYKSLGSSGKPVYVELEADGLKQ